MKQLIFLILLLFAIGAMCQPDPNVVMGDPGMQPGRQIQMPQQWNGMGFDMNRWREMNLENQLNQAEMLIELSDSGIFIYKAGVLAKLDYFNLAVQKKIELFGALPAKPVTIQQPPNVAGGQDKDSAKYTEEINKRTAQATIIQNQDALLFIIGDTFFKINPQTLNIDLQTDLAKKIVQPNPNVVDMRKTLKPRFGYQVKTSGIRRRISIRRMPVTRSIPRRATLHPRQPRQMLRDASPIRDPTWPIFHPVRTGRNWTEM